MSALGIAKAFMTSFGCCVPPASILSWFLWRTSIASSIAELMAPMFALSLNPDAAACSVIQLSYCVWSVWVKRARVLERKRFVNQLPLVNLAFTLPSTNVTSKVLWLTWIEPFLGAVPCADRKWFWNETFAMCSTVGIGICFLL